jgi:DNA-binding CsgD family transcriptional regulator
MDHEAIVDRIYEAALLPDLWPTVLGTIAEQTQTEGGILFAVPPPNITSASASPLFRWTASDGVVELFEKFIRDGWLQRNTRGERALKLNHAGFVRDQDLYTDDELAVDPLHNFAKANGLGWAAGMTVQVPTGDALILTWERRYNRGPFTCETIAFLDTLKAHLSRASLMSSRLGLERARAAAETLALLGLPAAVLSPRHRILAANALLQALMPAIVKEGAAGRIHLANKNADGLLTNALNQMHHADTRQDVDRVFSFPAPATEEHPPMVIHLVPVKRAAQDIFSAATSIVIVTPVSRSEAPSATVIQGLFDLTPAESRVARLIAGGDSVNDIAVTSNTSAGTVRNQLKAVFAKTGVSRQGDLISLLSNVNVVRKHD